MSSNLKNTKPSSKVEKQFIVEGCIGQGTFSVVYRVFNVKNKRKYALKKVFVDKIANEDHRANCFNEVNLLQIARHPNVIRFFFCEYNQSKTSGSLNLILELAPAGDLHQFISGHAKKTSLIAEKKIWKFMSQLSAGISYLHSHLIMHRDLKPANIYLSKNEDIKIGDFGLGKHFPNENEIFATSVLGSPYYMSPERLLQKEYYFNCDVWSLGCVIYELAALQSPFYVNKLDINLLIKRVVKCDYPPLPSDAFSKELQNIIAVCLTVDCAKRPVSKQILNLVNQQIEMNLKKTVGACV